MFLIHWDGIEFDGSHCIRKILKTLWKPKTEKPELMKNFMAHKSSPPWAGGPSGGKGEKMCLVVNCVS